MRYFDEILKSIHPIWKKADAKKDNLNFWKDFAEIGEDAKELVKIGKIRAKKNAKKLS